MSENNKWLVPALIGGLAGLVIGVLLSNFKVQQVEVIKAPKKHPLTPEVKKHLRVTKRR